MHGVECADRFVLSFLKLALHMYGVQEEEGYQYPATTHSNNTVYIGPTLDDTLKQMTDMQQLSE